MLNVPVVCGSILLGGFVIGKILQFSDLWYERRQHQERLARINDLRARVAELERRRFMTPEQRRTEDSKTPADIEYDRERTIDVECRFID